MVSATHSRRGICAFVLASLAFALFALGSCKHAQKEALVVGEMRIPTPESGDQGLEAIMVRPNDGVPHPLALITHGTSIGETLQETPLRYVPQAREFARRGWTAVVVLRRGYGGSGGLYAEETDRCSSSQNFLEPTEEAVKDLRGAVSYLATRPEVDASRIIGIGQSTGGMAMVGLSADPPAGLKAAISFAGGRGSDGHNHVCNPEALVQAFADLGRRSKVPMLWVYASNDHFFGPDLARQLYIAFADNGGTVRFVATGPFGEDGHDLFTQRGAATWTPIVDEFLLGQNLALRDTPMPDPPPDVAPPRNLARGGRDDFQGYLLGAEHKAFALSRTGAYGYSFGRRTIADAQVRALGNCAKFASPTFPCAVVMVDDQRTQN